MGDFFVVSAVINADANVLDKWFQDYLIFFAIAWLILLFSNSLAEL